MRIFAMIDSFQVGGSERQVAEVAVRLAARGHDVTVGCLKKQGFFLRQIEDAGIEVIEFSPGSSMLGLKGMRAIVRLTRYLKAAKFDVVQTHDLYSNLLAIPAAWLARVPRIASSRRDLGSWWWYTPRNRKVLRLIQRLSHVVVANSNGVRDYLINDDGFRPSHVRVLYNGIDVARFANTRAMRREVLPNCESKQLVVVLANMHSHTKGHEHIITAAPSVCLAFPQCVFVLVGDGELRAEFEQRVREIGLEQNFIFLGSRNDVPAILMSCDIGLLASRAEGLPNAVLEYMAAGLPVIATSVGGIPELVGNSGAALLVPPCDPVGLAGALMKVLAETATAKEMGAAGRERVRERFSFDRLLNDLEGLYSEIKPFSKDMVRSHSAELTSNGRKAARVASSDTATGAG